MSSQPPPVPPSVATSPPSPSIDWDGAVDNYRRKSNTRAPSFLKTSPPSSSAIPAIPSPFHRPTSPQRPSQPPPPSNAASFSPSSAQSTPSPTAASLMRGGPPPVPNQFRRGASPSITVSAPPSASTPSSSPHPSPTPSPSPTPLTPVYPPPTPSCSTSTTFYSSSSLSPSSTPSHSTPPPAPTPSPPSASLSSPPPPSFLRDSKQAVLQELRTVYTPFPAYQTPTAGASPHPKLSGLRVIVTAKRKARKDREESKQPPATPSSQGGRPTGGVVRGVGRVEEEEKVGDDDADDDDDDEDVQGMSEEQQRATFEDDVAHSWVEFIDRKSSTRVYINVRTGDLAWEKPKGMDDSDDSREEEDDGDRSRSAERGGKSEEQQPVDVPADELSDLFTLTTIPPARLLSSLRYMERAVEQVLTKAVNLPPALITSLSTVQAQFGSSLQVLSTLVSSSERSPVEALIAFDTLPWSFASSQAASGAIDHYRAASAAAHADRPDAAGSQVDPHPTYVSTFPLPAHLTKYRVQVRIGEEGDVVPRLLQVELTERTSATQVLKDVLLKDKGLQRGGGGGVGAVDEYLLKALGLEEYMMGERPMFEYEYVRQQMRDLEDVHLVVVRRATAIAAVVPLPVPHPLTVDYLAKVNPAVTPPTKASWAHLSLKAPLATLTAFSVYDVHLPFRYKVLGLDYLSPLTLPLLSSAAPAGGSLPSAFSSFTLRSFLFHGTVKLADSAASTAEFSFASSQRFGSWTTGGSVLMDAMPRGTRVAFVLVGRREDGKEAVLAWVVRQLVDEAGEVLMGRRELKMWGVKEARGKKHGARDDDAFTEAHIFRATNAHNECDRECVRLTVLFQPFALPVVYPLYPPPPSRAASKTLSGAASPAIMTKQQQKALDELLRKDALFPFTAADLALLYTHRTYLQRVPHALPTFLQAVNWTVPEQRADAGRLLREWTPFFTPVSALLLLDAQYADAGVREHAVTILRRLADCELALYLLQLVQCLKHEAYHQSALSAFLVERAVASPISIGAPLFWHLKNELHSPYHCERYVLVLEELLSFSPALCHELLKQVVMVRALTKVSEMVQRLKRDGLHDHEVEREYQKELHRLNDELFAQQPYFLSPLHPKKRATTLVVDKCRYMSSKMVPLWLVFRNADPYTHQGRHHVRGGSSQPAGGGSASISSPAQGPQPGELLYMIFKSGDDLRQDILTLQLLRYMDQLWLAQQIDLKLKPYAVVATGVNEHGDGIGLIDVVLNSETTSGIQLNPLYGGGTTGAFKLDPIDSFIRHHNAGKVTALVQAVDGSVSWEPRAAYDVAVDNFVHSCAGYCVATFVLGIGDRHNGNIMVTKRGHLFHIDFGHFLGNFKKKFGVNRERAAFVFTPEMAFVMGGSAYAKSPLFKSFLALSKRAFKVLRGRVNELEMLFLLMVNAGMPELTSDQDVWYMRDKLYVDELESKAEKKLTKEIDKSLNSSYRRFDNWVHNIRHK